MSARNAVALAVALWLGLALGTRCGPSAAVLFLVAGAVAASAPARIQPAIALAVAFFLLGLARSAACLARDDAALHGFPRHGAMTRLRAIVAEPPRQEGDRPACALEVLGSRPALPRGARVRLHLPEHTDAEWADTVDVLARLDPLPGPRNPGGFDARSAAQSARVVLAGRAFACRVHRSQDWRSLPVRAAMRLRRACEAALARQLSPAARELAAPLLFGDRDGMRTETDSALRASGLVHLLALSGLHVAWLAGIARGLVATCRGGILARATAGALSALAYALVAGPIPSLARAVAAEAGTALSRAGRRASDPIQSLGIAVVTLLAWQPSWAGDLGFQLSCVATLGLVAIGGPLTRLVPRVPAAAHGVVAALITTLGAQLAAMPLLLARFHALPWTSLGANLLAVPVSELLLAAAGVGALADAALPGCGHLWLAACEPLAWCLHEIPRRAGAWPGALPAAGASAWPVAFACLGTALLALALPERRALNARRRDPPWHARALVAGALLSALALVAMGLAPPLRPPDGRWWCVVLDVGQGDAIAIADGHGWWLVDTGVRSEHWDAGEAAVLPFLRWAGVRALDRVVLTHDDGDHTGGYLAVRRGIRVRAAVGPAPRPGIPGPCARFGTRPVARGDTLARAPAAVVLWPPRPGEPDAPVATRGDNSAALVLEVGDEGPRALLTADADSVVENHLAWSGTIALLKAGHHGARSSSGGTFVARVQAQCAAISCGAHNVYGHPHAEALARITAAGTRIDRTDRDGALWYEFGPQGLRHVDWRCGEPLRAHDRNLRAAGAVTASRAF